MSKSILIVDDSSLARMMMKNIISQSFSEWKIIEANNGDEGMKQADNNHVDMALIDFNMPGMNGIDLSAQLLEKHPEIKIHLVTANIQEKMRQRAEAMGIGFIMKPISKDKLVLAMTAN